MKDLEKEVVVMAATSTTYTFTGTLDVTESAAVGTSNSGAHPPRTLHMSLSAVVPH